MSTIHKAAVSQRHCHIAANSVRLMIQLPEEWMALLLFCITSMRAPTMPVVGAGAGGADSGWSDTWTDTDTDTDTHTQRSEDPICLLQVQFVFDPINHRSMYVFTYLLTMCYYDTTILNFNFQISFYSAPCFKLIFVLSCPTISEPPLDYFWY